MGIPKLDAGPQKSVRVSVEWVSFGGPGSSCVGLGRGGRTCRAEIGEDGAGADFGIEG